MRKRIISILLPVLLLFSSLRGQTISVNGAWDLTVSATDLIAGPGSDLADTYTSATDAAYVDVTVFPYIWNWQVSVSMTTIRWHSNLQLWVRRTGNGSSWFGTISGGTSYQMLNATPQTFFIGLLNRQDIPMQYQIRNVSALIPAATYSVDVVYTLEER